MVKVDPGGMLYEFGGVTAPVAVGSVCEPDWVPLK